jgi:hypothetical protein
MKGIGQNLVIREAREGARRKSNLKPMIAMVLLCASSRPSRMKN